MDLVVGVERVQVLGLVKIPEHGGAILATGGAEGTVGGDGDGVDVAGVADVIGLQLAAGELPDLRFAEETNFVSRFWNSCANNMTRQNATYVFMGEWDQAKVNSLSHGLCERL